MTHQVAIFKSIENQNVYFISSFSGGVDARLDELNRDSAEAAGKKFQPWEACCGPNSFVSESAAQKALNSAKKSLEANGAIFIKPYLNAFASPAGMDPCQYI